MQSFKNCVLLVCFQHSHLSTLKDFISKIYSNYFKTIIFYSNLPNIGVPDINYIDMIGRQTNYVFYDFYNKYKDILDTSDGLFVTTDDCIINVNILNTYSTDKIIYYFKDEEYKPLEQHHGWQWDVYPTGKWNIYRMLEDEEYKKHFDIKMFSGFEADMFYLPKKYINNRTFLLFKLFTKYNVFMELTIPTIINYIEQDKNKYQLATTVFLWGEDRDTRFANKENLYQIFCHSHNLAIHPVRTYTYSEIKKWLIDIFCKEKCVIVEASIENDDKIKNYINDNNYEVILVADNKSSYNFANLNCVVLDTRAQEKLFPNVKFANMKQFGYLYALKRGYKIICDTDINNIIFDNNDLFKNYTDDQLISKLKGYS